MSPVVAFALGLLAAVAACQQPLTRGQATTLFPPTSAATVGSWNRSPIYKSSIVAPQIAWWTPVEITYSAHSGAFQSGETITQNTTGATGILCYFTSTVLMIRPVSGTFTGAYNVVGNESGAATTAVAAFAQSTQYVWSAYHNQARVLAFNGSSTRGGGASCSLTYSLNPTLYGTGSGIYLENPAERSVCTYSSKTTSFTLGEVVTQGAATGRIYFDSGSAISIECSSTTYFNGSQPITGATSGAVATVTGDTNTGLLHFLEWSPDGWTNFVPVAVVDNSTTTGTVPVFKHTICDCGTGWSGSIGGHSATRLLLYFDYCEGNPNIWYCLPDIAPFTWTCALQATGTPGDSGPWPGSNMAIRHFHGGEYVPGLGSYGGRLFIFMGDADYQCGIGVCDNVADLCNSGSNWLTYLGLNLCGPARIFWALNTACTQTVLTTTGTSGAFNLGERVSQNGSNAVGYISSISGSTLTLLVASGTFDSSHVINGQPSSATATATSSTSSTIGGGYGYYVGNNANSQITGSPAGNGYFSTGVQGIGGQDCRTVELVIDSTSTFGYFVPDEAQNFGPSGCQPNNDGYALPVGANLPRRLNLASKIIQTFGTRVAGTGWAGCLTPDGTVLLSTESDHTAPGPAYYGNCDSYCHLYAIGTDGSTVYEVARFLRQDYLNPGINASTVGGWCTAFGAVFAWDAEASLFDSDPIGIFNNRPSVAISDQSINRLTASLPTPQSWVWGGRFQQATDSNYWYLSNMAHFSQVSSPVDLDEGQIYSCEAGGAGGGSTTYAQYTLQTFAMYALRGKFVTARARVWAPTTLSSSQAPYIELLTASGDTTYAAIPLSDTWQTISLSVWVPPSEGSISIRVIPDLAGNATGNIFVSDISISEGTSVPNGLTVPPNLGNQLLIYGQAGDQQLTIANSQYNITQLQLSARVLEFIGSPSGPETVNFPATVGATGTQAGQYYVLSNKTSVVLTVKENGQAGFSLGAGARCLAYYDGTDVRRLTLDTLGDGLALTNVQIASGSTYLVTTTGGSYIACQYTSTGAQTITLPASPQQGEVHYVVDEGGSAATHTITIAGNGNTIHGASSISTNYGYMQMRWNGSAWFQVG